MKYDVILHGNIDSINNFEKRVTKLAELIGLDVNFIGPFLGAKESSVKSNVEFQEARTLMNDIKAIGFNAEVRPRRERNKAADITESNIDNDTSIDNDQTSSSLYQNRAKFSAPDDKPEVSSKSKKSAGKFDKIKDSSDLELKDESTEKYDAYNWSKDTDSDDIVKFNDDLIVKKGR